MNKIVKNKLVMYDIEKDDYIRDKNGFLIEVREGVISGVFTRNFSVKTEK